MIQRFHIEDLIAQDSSGVVFRALDTKTGQPVAVRRFFPFGMDGGGLNAAEQPAYRRALGRLASLNHPALRAVIAGGCDPVDGMPFIATEWIEGAPLQALIAHEPLPAPVATELLTAMLEVCELLSDRLGEEGLWVETDLQTIILGSQRSGRRFTFWISPLTWLGEAQKSCGLTALITLTENLLGWQDRPVSARAGGGLGGWLNWLRHASLTASLHEARAALAAAVVAAPPYATRHLVIQPAQRPMPVPAPAPAHGLWVVNLGLAGVATALGGWLFVHQHEPAATLPPPTAAAQALPDPPPAEVPASPPAPIGHPDAAPPPRGLIPRTNRKLSH